MNYIAHPTDIPLNPSEEFSMLNEIFEQQVFELCIHEENGQKAYYIPYMMNDALECYLILEHCRMTGEYQPETDENEEEGPCSGQLEEKDDLFGLIVRQGQDRVFTLWFRSIRKVLKCYQYHAIGHFWQEGQEQWRRLVYILGTIHDKYQYLGEEVCSGEEQELLKLAEFSPLRRWSPLGDPAEPPAPSSEAGIEAMKALAQEAGDRTYERLLILYEKFPWPFLGKLLAKQLTDPGRTGIYELLEKKIQSASEKYPPRDYGKQCNTEIRCKRKQADEALKRLGFSGTYPEYRKKNIGVIAMEEHPFTVMESEEFQFCIRFMVSICSEGHWSRNGGFFRGAGRKSGIAQSVQEIEEMTHLL